LLDQKIQSLDSVEAYWHARLWDGTTTSDGSEWLQEVPKDALFQDYVKTSLQTGERRRVGKPQFGKVLCRFGVEPTRAVERDEHGNTTRPWRYAIQPLSKARERFDKLVGQAVDWPACGVEAGETVPI
jgi:hypothetical protein